ncbi:hypothetical protein CLU83_3283 [Flavobacterium sp. 1]|nr:hypothetical protein CLU83_3283 [Flavobacterium sp. 1]
MPNHNYFIIIIEAIQITFKKKINLVPNSQCNERGK